MELPVIFLVDPDVEAAEHVVSKLSAQGWWVSVVPDGDAALRAAAAHAPRLVIVHRRAAPYDGVVEAFGRATGGPGVILLDVKSAEETPEGTDAVLFAPVEVEELIAAVRSSMRGSEAADALPDRAEEPSDEPERKFTSQDIFGDMLDGPIDGGAPRVEVTAGPEPLGGAAGAVTARVHFTGNAAMSTVRPRPVAGSTFALTDLADPVSADELEVVEAFGETGVAEIEAELTEADETYAPPGTVAEVADLLPPAISTAAPIETTEFEAAEDDAAEVDAAEADAVEVELVEPEESVEIGAFDVPMSAPADEPIAAADALAWLRSDEVAPPRFEEESVALGEPESELAAHGEEIDAGGDEPTIEDLESVPALSEEIAAGDAIALEVDEAEAGALRSEPISDDAVFAEELPDEATHADGEQIPTEERVEDEFVGAPGGAIEWESSDDLDLSEDFESPSAEHGDDGPGLDAPVVDPKAIDEPRMPDHAIGAPESAENEPLWFESAGAEAPTVADSTVGTGDDLKQFEAIVDATAQEVGGGSFASIDEPTEADDEALTANEWARILAGPAALATTTVDAQTEGQTDAVDPVPFASDGGVESDGAFGGDGDRAEGQDTALESSELETPDLEPLDAQGEGDAAGAVSSREEALVPSEAVADLQTEGEALDEVRGENDEDEAMLADEIAPVVDADDRFLSSLETETESEIEAEHEAQTGADDGDEAEALIAAGVTTEEAAFEEASEESESESAEAAHEVVTEPEAVSVVESVEEPVEESPWSSSGYWGRSEASEEAHAADTEHSASEESEPDTPVDSPLEPESEGATPPFAAAEGEVDPAAEVPSVEPTGEDAAATEVVDLRAVGASLADPPLPATETFSAVYDGTAAADEEAGDREDAAEASEEFAAESVEAVIASDLDTAAESAPTDIESEAVADAVGDYAGRAASTRTTSPWVWIAAAAALLLVGAWFWLRGEGGGDEPAPVRAAAAVAEPGRSAAGAGEGADEAGSDDPLAGRPPIVEASPEPVVGDDSDLDRMLEEDFGKLEREIRDRFEVERRRLETQLEILRRQRLNEGSDSAPADGS